MVVAPQVLLPQVIGMCAGKALVVAAGGIYDGRGIAACLSMGASGAWIGTAFLATPEANVEDVYKQKLLEADSSETIRSEIYTGRPARSIQTPYNLGWAKREADMRDLLSKGVIPQIHDAKQLRKEGKSRSMSEELKKERTAGRSVGRSVSSTHARTTCSTACMHPRAQHTCMMHARTQRRCSHSI